VIEPRNKQSHEVFTLQSVGTTVDVRQASASTSAGVVERGKCTEGYTGTFEGSMSLETVSRWRTRRDTNKPGCSVAPTGQRREKKQDENGASQPVP